MAKKDLPTTIRQMHGFAPIKLHTAREVLEHDAAKDAAKDKLIAELRASLAELEARSEKARAASREGMKKLRANRLKP